MRSWGRILVGILGLSVTTTATGVWIAYQLELRLVSGVPSFGQIVLIGFIEEAFVRLVPLVVTFYLWSFTRGELLSKLEGLAATIISGMTVAGLELVIKLDYLARLEMVARFDALVLPILFVHLPFALVAGRFAYALGERIHGTGTISIPTFSRRTFAALFIGYLFLAVAHITYNVLIG